MRRFNETYKKRQFITRNDWADTYKSIHAETEETVILKVISNRSENEEYINNLSKEVEELKQIKHPNLTYVHGIFKYDGIGQAHYYYIEGEYFKGISLKDRLNDRKFEKNEAIKIVEQLAKALEKFHDMSKSFEVLNVENILINPKGPKNHKDLIKIDILSYLENKRFDLDVKQNLKDLENDEEDKNLDENIFSPDKDIYSLGVVLYSLVSGKINFENGKYKKDIDDENLLKIIQKAINEKSVKGYPNLRIFINDLKSYLESGELKSDSYDYELEDLDNKKSKKNKSKNKKGKKVLAICVLFILFGGASIKGFDLLEKINNDKPVDSIEKESIDSKKEEKADKEEAQREKEEIDKSESDKATTSNNNSKPSKTNNTNNSSNSNTTNNNQNNSNSNTTNNNSNSGTNNNNSNSNNNSQKPNESDNNQNLGDVTNKPDSGNNNGALGGAPEALPPDTINGGSGENGGSAIETPEAGSQE